MYCLSKICYICLIGANNHQVIKRKSPENKQFLLKLKSCMYDIKNLTKSGPDIIICEKCYASVEETYNFMQKCRKNSKLLQGYVSRLKNRDKETGLNVVLTVDSKLNDMIKKKTEDNNNNNSPLGEQATITEHDSQIGEESILEYDWPLQFVQAEIDGLNISNNVQEPINKCVKFQDNLELENINRCHEFMDAGIFYEEPGGHYMEFDSGLIKCVVCNETFMNNYYLNEHMKIHEKIYECPICDSEIHGKSNFESHITMHAQKTKLHKCPICNKLFTTTRYVKIHMSVHSDEKPYTCNICGKKFSLKVYLNRHMISHYDEKRYRCSICDKTFVYGSSLARHMKKHPGQV